MEGGRREGGLMAWGFSLFSNNPVEMGKKVNRFERGGLRLATTRRYERLWQL